MASVPLRARVYGLLEGGVATRTPRAVVTVIMVLIVLSIGAMILESVPTLAQRFGWLFRTIEAIALVVFTVEYATRLWVAVEHPPFAGMTPWQAAWAQARSPLAIIDLLAILPFYAGVLLGIDLEFVAVLRVLRFLKLARYSPGLASLVDAILAERHALIACLVILAGAVVTSATAMYLVEHTTQPEKFGTIPDAMWWSIVTLTTVGYGDVFPVTVAGRVIGALTMVTGLVMLALPVGILASAFAREIQRHDFVVTWGMVARVPLFAGLDANAVASVMRLLKSDVIEAGHLIYRQGDNAHSMYFVASGEIELSLVQRRIVVQSGGFFGEMAVLAQSHRTATARALSRSRLLTLEANDLHRLMAEHPDLASRIRETAAERIRPERLDRDSDMISEEVSPPQKDTEE